MKERINVGHFIRIFLQSSETFIMNQINFLNVSDRFEPIVFTKIYLKDNRSNIKNPNVVGELLSPVLKKWDDFLYKYFRKLSKKGKEAILNEIKRKDIKVLHFHFLVDARYYIDVILEAKLPVIISAYGYDVSNFPSKYFGYGKLYLQKLFANVDLFLAMSKDMKKDLIKIGCPEKKIKIHYHGINVERFGSIERKYEVTETFNLLFCGRLTSKKGPDIFLKAINEIIQNSKTEKQFRVRIVGDGPLQNDLIDFVKEHKLDNIVSFLGHIAHSDSSLINEYKNADIFILPSLVVKNNRKTRNDKEGIPGTIIEALCSGLPVISTYHAGIPEVINHEFNGLLVNEGDYLELASAIVRLLEDCSFREEIGTNAKKSSKNLNVKLKTKELIDIYDSTILNFNYNQNRLNV